MAGKKPVNREMRYLSYLLRLWQESGSDPPLWRASIEGARSDKRQGFASLMELFAFLTKETKAGPLDLHCSDERGCRHPHGRNR
jgi:hypothetical protein